MKFKLTRAKELVKEPQDYELLEDMLKDYADAVNHSYKGWVYEQRVFFHVSADYYHDRVRVAVGFKSRHLKENEPRFRKWLKYKVLNRPDKYGNDFRKECIHVIIDFADEALDENRNSFLLTVREDFEAVEERLYERK